MTRILTFSDLHLSRHAAAEIRAAAATADLVIGAGDFCNGRHGLDEAMEMLWTLDPDAIYVPGNAESADELRAATASTVLHGQSVQRNGLTISNMTSDGGGKISESGHEDALTNQHII